MKSNVSINLYKNNRRNSSYENVSSIFKDNKYTMILDEVKTIISKDIVIRENDSYKFTLDINNKTATYLLKEKNMLFDILVENVSVNYKKTNIIIEYKLESDDEVTKIEIIDKEEKNE